MVDEFGAMIALVGDAGRTWEQYISDSRDMDQEGAWNDPHFGTFQWQYHVPEPVRAIWSDLMEQGRVALYWATQKMAQEESDSYKDA